MKIKRPEDVDALVAKYEDALAKAESLRNELIAAVELSGVAPANAKVSKRLAGVEKSVMVTWGTSTSIDEAAVGRLQEFLEEKKASELFDELFVLQTPPVYVPPPPRHRRLGDSFETLHGLKKRLNRKLEDRIAALYGEAVVTRANAPTLKIEEAAGRG